MIKMVVFDMAGTVVDEQNVVYKTLHRSIQHSGFNTDLKTVLKYGAGKDKLQAIIDTMAHLSGRTDVALARTTHQWFKDELAKSYQTLDVKPQPGANEVFTQLRQVGVKVVLNTGYDRPTAEGLLQKLNWVPDRDIDYLVTASDVTNGRPAPDMIFAAMKHFGIESGEAVAKVGDSMIDIEEGDNADCRFSIGVTTGAHTREQLASVAPSHIINHLSELLPIVVPYA